MLCVCSCGSQSIVPPNSAVKTLGEAESADEEARLWVEKMRTMEKEREMAEKRVSVLHSQ